MAASEPSSKPQGTVDKQATCPDCGGVLVPTQWLTSIGEYPVKEVVTLKGKVCGSCNYMWFEDPFAKE